MDYQPRTVAYLCDLLHPPHEADPRPVQRLHNRMFESGAPTYSTFAVTPLGPVLANPPSRPGTISQVAFLEDRVQFREELGDMAPDDFAVRVRDVASEAAPLRGISLFLSQTVTLRSLVNPRHFADTRPFLRDAVFGFGDQLEALGRSPNLFGLRLTFPPEPGASSSIALRIESFQQDPRSLFLEVVATYAPVPVPRPVRAADDRPDAPPQPVRLEPLARNVQRTYEFLTDRALPFVARFDARQPS